MFPVNLGDDESNGTARRIRVMASVDPILGWEPSEDLLFERESLGFGLGLAVFSTTKVPVPLDVASTGILREEGSIAPVNGVDDKIALMRVEHPEATRFLIPEGFARRRSFPSVSVERVSSLEELWNKAFQTNGQELVQKRASGRVDARILKSLSQIAEAIPTAGRSFSSEKVQAGAQPSGQTP